MSLPAALALAALSGFIALSYEIVWYRVVSYATASAPWVFGALLGAYLAGIAAATWAVKRVCVRKPQPRRADVRLVSAFVFVANAAGYLVIPAAAALAGLGVWQLVLGLIALSAGLLGAVLPLATHFAVPPDSRVGSRLSYVYVANIVGSTAGSALTGYVLLEVLTLREISVGLAAAGAALAAVLWCSGERSRLGRAAGLAAAEAVAAGAVFASPRLFDRLWERLHARGDAAEVRFSTVIENRHGVIAVTESGTVFGGGAYDGAFSLDPVQDANGISRAYAVAALHPAPRNVLLIGLGSGSWARALASLPGVERLTAVEINPGYLSIIAAEPLVAPLLGDPRIEIAIDDGRRWLVRNPARRFDVIVANVTLHWRAHASGLLSREFVRLVRDRLAPGGVYYFNATGSGAARDTALAEFRTGVEVGSFLAVSDRELCFDRDRLRAALLGARIDGAPVLDPSDARDLERLETLLGAPHPTLSAPRSAARVTDDNMLTEFGGR